MLLDVLFDVVQQSILLIFELTYSYSQLLGKLSWPNFHLRILQVSLQALDLIGQLLIALFRIGKVLFSDGELTLKLDNVGRELLLRQMIWRERLLPQVLG